MPVQRPSDSSFMRRLESQRQRPIAATLRLPHSHVAVIDDSHGRCAAQGLSRFETPDLSPLGRSELAILRDRNARLYTHATPIMEMLFDQIVHTQSMVVLCDVTGTVLHSLGDDEFLARASKVALQPGANWSESTKGTNAVGTALVSEKPTLVHADEHFIHVNHFLTCSAAPILDPRGNILGVLDVSGEHRSYHQHTMALVTMSARMIENHWLTEDYRHVMRLHFHSRASFIGTLSEGILAVTAEGRIVGANRSALDYVGLSGASLRMLSLEALFGVKVNALVDHFRSPLAAPFEAHATNGQTVHLIARFDWPVWHNLAEAAVLAGTPSVPTPSVALKPALSFTTKRLRLDDCEGASTPRSMRGLEAFETGDATMAALVDKARRYLDLNSPILLLGETGTGKSLLARALHQSSRRCDKPFITINCAGLTPSLVDQMFVGHQSAFTAVPRLGQASALHEASGGTLFLDEIGDAPLDVQARLLTVLQPGLGSSLGSSPAAAPNDVAVISATQRPLRDMVAAQRFREDLYYRLNGLTLKLPALRERSDLRALTQQILDHAGGPKRIDVATDVHVALQAFEWPGNVRQLVNVLSAACAMLRVGSTLERSHLPEDFLDELRLLQSRARPLEPTSARTPLGRLPLDDGATKHAASLDAIEMAAIRAAVEACRGNISSASKHLGISRNTIYRKLRGHAVSK